ncbi:hypothetical protein [Hoeflea sp. BAL378]|uniref:hypothetical protein n=1 Tax=Hoeflea sp. BAL378 TaxID=1547437 RepID=UPI00126A5BA0|nr:hypothetical protein [Hoeflea sp. BAL378]
MKTPEYIATDEVLCCATQLIATLARSASSDHLADQALSLFDAGEQDDQVILSHWIVSHWLAERLEKAGETVDLNFAGMAIWGRRTTGQRIYCDDVIRKISEATRA